MDASTIQSRQGTLITPASSQRPKSVENNEPSIETRSDNDQGDSLQVSKETVKLSDTSLKLSSSSPVKSSDQAASIENKDQAQQALSQLIANIQSNPSQAQGAHSNIFDGAVKSLLG
ncbi:MAG: hypothetical protein Q7T96_09810 [Methylobacter sp.]|nr:hypothetical protein [Methylobacter sp.]